MILKKSKNSYCFDLSRIFFILFLNSYFHTKVLPNFETGLSAQSHGCRASAISSYTLAEQTVSKQQLIKISLPWLYI